MYIFEVEWNIFVERKVSFDVADEAANNAEV